MLRRTLIAVSKWHIAGAAFCFSTRPMFSSPNEARPISAGTPLCQAGSTPTPDECSIIDRYLVFLRVLEYYAGILFLTTNRVGTFDEAFKSRIHMSLWYPTLSHKSTKRIWKMNLDRTKEKEKELGLKVDEVKIMDFADNHWRESEEEGSGFWNGRQIRNGMVSPIFHDLMLT